MPGNQRKKRVNASTSVACSSHKKDMVKRKKPELQQSHPNLIPTISLQWDNTKKNVVSKRGQIGILQKHLIPYSKPDTHSHLLADVFSIPLEIFELENLSEVLSYEVWQSLLSKNERSLLSQYLPKDTELDTLIHGLLSGDNFHFGNPFLLWGALLCSGELHPDYILHEEQSLKACKNAYYLHLQMYHNKMIKHLQLWKEKWDSCDDPETDIVQKMWKCSSNHSEILGLDMYGTEVNLAATPDSCSWADSEKAYSSDNHHWGNGHGDTERRKDFFVRRGNNSFSGKKMAAIPKRGEKVQKRNIELGDVTKYMFYIKVSKQQHERAKSSIKRSGNSMQRRSLNHVLGTMDVLNLQPFERFEEEEKGKLQDYWLKLANQDISEGFANWRKRQLSRRQLIQCLGEEVVQKLQPEQATLNEEKEGSQDKLFDPLDDTEKEILSSISLEGTEQSHIVLLEQKDSQVAVHEIETEQEDEKEQNEYEYEEQALDADYKIENVDIPDHVIIQDPLRQQDASDKSSRVSAKVMEPSNHVILHQHQEQTRVVSVNHRIKVLELESIENTAGSETDGDVVSLYSGKMNHVNSPTIQGSLLTSAIEVWPAGDVHGLYCQPVAPSTEYDSSQELTLGHPQFMQEQPLRMLNLVDDRQDKETGKDILLEQSNHSSFFSSYAEQDRNELLQSFFKGQNSLPYHHEQKHLSSDFETANGLMMDAVQFHGHLTEQVHPSIHLEQKQKTFGDLYMQQNLQQSVYTDGGRYAIPRQAHLPVNSHDWTPANPVRMAGSSQPLNRGEMNQNWYSGESGVQDAWPTFESAGAVNHNLNSVRNSDQTLFSVLSECSKLQPGAGYDSTASTERLIQVRNYSGMGEGIPSSSVPPQATHTFNYLHGHEASAGGGVKMNNNLGWMGVSKQNSGNLEPMGKPFLRSWNQ